MTMHPETHGKLRSKFIDELIPNKDPHCDTRRRVH